MIEDMLTQQLELRPRVEGFTGPTWGPAVQHNCRYQEGFALVTGPGGKTIASEAQAWLPPGTVVRINDRVDYQGTSYRVCQLARRRDLEAERHVQIWLTLK